MDGAPVAIPGAKPRAILTMLGLHGGSVVPADVLTELLWADEPPRTAAKALQTHISSLRHALGDGFVVTEGSGWRLNTAQTDASRYQSLTKSGRDALGAGDINTAVIRFDEAARLWRGVPELPDGRRGMSEKTRWVEAHAALAEDRADALLASGRAAEIIGDLEAAVAEAPLRERRWGQLMLALYRAGRQGEALGAYRRARSLLADELGVDPGSELRRLEAAIVAQDPELDFTATQHVPSVTRAVTFLLTDIEGSTAAWEADAGAMALALARHDELVEQVVTSRGGRLIKTRGEGDATFSVFDRPSAAAAAAIELQDAIFHEPWGLSEPMRIRIALHTGEAELRDGDYFGRAVNRAARLRSQAGGGQILCSGATAELVIDSLSDDIELVDLGMRRLKNLARPEHIFELRLQTAESPLPTDDSPIERPAIPAVLTGPGPFVGRGRELAELLAAWHQTIIAGTRAVLIAGEPGVGKTRLAGEWCRQAHEQGAVVLYGRSDEDLGAPYQPFAEALRTLVPCIGPERLRGMRGVEALLPLVPALTDVLPDVAAPPRADPDTERYALFDAVVALLGVASADVPIVLVLDDLHWAAKPTLLLLRHLLRFGEHARVQIIGTYRSTDLDRSHPLAAMLADLHRDGSANRIALGGLDEEDVTAYVAEAGYDDEELARALASVTGGNPFFLIEALRHVDESGGHWDPSTLPQGVREAVSRRLSRLPEETNKALAAAAVVGSQFSLDLVELVVGQDLVDAFDEACQAGILIEEAGGLYRFNHAIVRQSLLAELASVRRMRLHQRIAATLETMPGADDELLADLAHHYFECAWAGNALKAIEYCRRAADQAVARLAYEGAADLYDHALHALEELDDELPDRDDQRTELLVARCEALLAAGDVSSAASAVSQLKEGTRDSARLTAWATCFESELSMLVDPERLDDIESAVGAAAVTLAELGDAAGEAKAHTVRAGCLARLGRVADCELALDNALTAARQAGDHRLVNAVLAGAPLAALWGPNPVPRAGGRCLDVVRLLRITTDSPAVEATSTRCQAVLEAFRSRAAAARRMIDAARRVVTELGLRHARLEVEHFAGYVELVIGDAAAAEQHLRLAYNGFRRLRLDVDTAEAAALLARACLLLDRDGEADELCSESERLAGHALKASITWRTVRAQLLSHAGSHSEARRVAEEAVSIAARTDALVDHGDACVALATVLGAAGDAVGARAAAERATDLYERKGAVALVERARSVVGHDVSPTRATEAETPVVERVNECLRVVSRLHDAVAREAWAEVEPMLAPNVTVENRRRIVGFERVDCSPSVWIRSARGYLDAGVARIARAVLAVRGERLALFRLTLSTADGSPGAPQDELLRLMGIDENDRVCLHMSFDLDDMDAAIAELDAQYARFETGIGTDTAATRASQRAVAAIDAGAWDEFERLFAPEGSVESRRRLVGFGPTEFRYCEVVHQTRCDLENGIMRASQVVIAVRGERLALARVGVGTVDESPGAPHDEFLQLFGLDTEGRIALQIWFDLDDMDAALAELDALQAQFEQGQRHAPLRNSATQVNSRINDLFAVKCFDEIALLFAKGVWVDDRRRGIRGEQHGRAGAVANIRAIADLGVVNISTTPIAVRGDHLCLSHASLSVQGGFDAESLTITKAVGGLIQSVIVFDVDDIDAALAELDAQHARFEEESSAAPLENVASHVYRDILANYAVRDWDAIRSFLAEDISTEDRRRIVNAGRRQGREAVIAEISAISEVGVTEVRTDVIATRGRNLVLCRSRATAGLQPEAFHSDLVEIIEVSADTLVSARLVFDVDDTDAAFAELDARYLAGEAASYAHVWSAVMDAYAGFNRREISATTPDWVNIDNRRAAAFAPGDLIKYIQAAWEDSPDTKIYVAAVHHLSERGAVVTHVAHGTSQDGFDAEWRDLYMLIVDGDAVCRSELFDEEDLDAALARFDELQPHQPRLENRASRQYHRFNMCLISADWDALAGTMADNFVADDRRGLLGSGRQLGRDAAVLHARTVADVGVRNVTSNVVATRGDRVALIRARFWGRDSRPDAFRTEVLHTVEIDNDGRITSFVAFDLDDLDAAFAELDARYLAGEAASYRQTWSVIAEAFAECNRGEIPPAASDSMIVDNRHGAAMAPDDGTAYFRASWELAADLNVHVESVHRLSGLGAVFTHVGHGTSKEGFEAEWRTVDIMMVDGSLISHAELFAEVDLDVALTRFDELSRPTPQLENAASRVYDRIFTYFASRDWAAMSEVMAEDIVDDDRRRGANAGIRRGRDAMIANMRTGADLGARSITSTVIATRGDRLVLRRLGFSGEGPAGFHAELLGIAELDADQRIAVVIQFDIDDLDAAFDELNARYLAGEAAPYAGTWSAVMATTAALNRHDLPATTPDFVDIDHRRAASIDAGDMQALLRTALDLTPVLSHHVEAVHRLTKLGAVITQVTHGTSHDGFEAEWRIIALLTFEGDLTSRCEVFDEDDLDTALATFDTLTGPTLGLDNTASQVFARIHRSYTAGDWDTVAELLADDAVIDDRRRFVGAGTWHGREAAIAHARAVASVGLGTDKITTIATRGKHLALMRVRVSASGSEQDRFNIDAYQMIEITTNEQVLAIVVFGLDDIEAAFAELEARYLAGEAAPHAQVWSVVSRNIAATNHHELPSTTPDWVSIDHHRMTSFESGGLNAYIRSSWDDMPDNRIYIETVHRLSDLGTVITHVATGTTPEGFDAEWWGVDIMTVDGELISRSELFEEDDLDAALARFDELSHCAPQLENAATRALEHLEVFFGARDWTAMAEILAEDIYADDRRPTVNSGTRHGVDAEIANLRTIAEVGSPIITSTIVATRGDRLALSRARLSGRSERPDAFHTDGLVILEVDADHRIVARIVFDPDDIDAALEELDARYLAGEAVAHARTWSAVVNAYAALNRQEIPPATTDLASVDHRHGVAFAPGELIPYVRARWDISSDFVVHIEAAHQLTNLGAVLTQAVHGTSREGLYVEWREAVLYTVDGDLINRCEVFDEADLDSALARFDELSEPPPT